MEHVVHTTRSYVLKGIDPKLAGPFLLRAPVGWINFAFLLFEHTWLFPGSTVGLAKLQIDTALPPGYWIQVGQPVRATRAAVGIQSSFRHNSTPPAFADLVSALILTFSCETPS